MKISFQTHPARKQQGNTLLICVIFTVVMGISLAGIFKYTTTQVTAVARSQSWNESLVLADAGIEDALQLINKYADTTTSPDTWTTTATTQDGWQKLSGVSVYKVTRNLGGGSYTAYVTNGSPAPTIYSVGTRTWQGGGNGDLQRRVFVATRRASLFQGALLAKGQIVLNGTIRIDSFNSQNPLYSTNGQYIASKAKDGGDIGTVSSNVVNAVGVGGSVDVFGEIYTGPGDTIKLNGGAQVGSMSWITGGSNGIQTDWSHSDLNIAIPDAPKPPTTSLVPLPSLISSYTFQGTPYSGDIYLLTAGNYNNAKPGKFDTILVSGNVNLILSADILKMTSSQKIIIGTNSSLKIYAQNDLDLGGGGAVNATGFATNLTVYGVGTNKTSIAYTGGSAFVGTIYAPYADVKLSGGGYMIGSVVGNSITTSGNYEIHYDESLVQQPAGPIFFAFFWQER
jgi:hypothetical protein